jgi:hypothetical protein
MRLSSRLLTHLKPQAASSESLLSKLGFGTLGSSTPDSKGETSLLHSFRSSWIPQSHPFRSYPYIFPMVMWYERQGLNLFFLSSTYFSHSYTSGKFRHWRAERVYPTVAYANYKACNVVEKMYFGAWINMGTYS